MEKFKAARPDTEILYGKYVDTKSKFHVKHLVCGYEWDASAHALEQPKGCPKCSGAVRKTHEEFVKELYGLNPDIEVIGTYTKNQDPILFRCKIDGYEWKDTPLNMLHGYGCPVCSNHVVIAGINNLNHVRPDLTRFLTNPEDGLYVSFGSKKKISCTCPDCGYSKFLPVHNLSKNGFTCPVCGDGISYPNKFIRAFVSQFVGNNYEPEYKRDWCKQYFYDCYFEYNNHEYIVEMDGIFHIKPRLDSTVSLEHIQECDSIKDKLAKEHGIEVIRIDCQKSTFDYIKESIEKSRLAEIFDLNKVDWDLCNKSSMTSLIKTASLYYENHKYDMTLNEIANHFKIVAPTLVRYIEQGKKYGWCNTSVKERRELCTKYINNVQRIPVKVSKNGKTIGEYKSLSLCVKELAKIGFKTTIGTIQKKIKTNNGLYNGLLFEYL